MSNIRVITVVWNLESYSATLASVTYPQAFLTGSAPLQTYCYNVDSTAISDWHTTPGMPWARGIIVQWMTGPYKFLLWYIFGQNSRRYVLVWMADTPPTNSAVGKVILMFSLISKEADTASAAITLWQ